MRREMKECEDLMKGWGKKAKECGRRRRDEKKK
jgi:hypothetical protein